LPASSSPALSSEPTGHKDQSRTILKMQAVQVHRQKKYGKLSWTVQLPVVAAVQNCLIEDKEQYRCILRAVQVCD
jgi:hypothetical protein